MLLAILLVPLCVGLLAVAVPWRAWIGRVSAFSSALVLTLGVVLSSMTLHHSESALRGTLRADSLSSFMVVVIGAVALLATLQTPRVMRLELASGRSSTWHASRYVALMHVFITCMLLAVLAANLGVLWVAVEATTIATTFLVSHHGTKAALEASWKYVVLCSVGIALAFLGTVLVYFASLHAGPHGVATLNWSALKLLAPHLNPGVMRVAMALVVLGYGTKVGLAPMHSWLADAHSQAPAPVSALMSGVLLSVAFYALLRFRAIADLTLGVDFVRGLFIGVGLLSLMVATLLLIAQRDLKRMLAYSSVEHMGLMALGVAAGGPLAISAVLLHMLGHGLTKATMFLTSGEILHVEGTTEMTKIHALLARRPALGGLFGVGLLSLVGLPPFSLFLSEFTMFRGEVNAGLAWVAILAAGLLSVIFVSMSDHVRRMLLGSSESAPTATSLVVVVPLVVALLACVGLGLVSWPLLHVLRHAALVVGR